MSIIPRFSISLAALLALFPLVSTPASGQTLVAPFDSAYSIFDLGAVAGVPNNYGGLAIKMGDPSKLLIGGAANGLNGALYEIGVIRDVDGHITAFAPGNAVRVADAAYNDGGIDYGPGGVLFLARWPVGEIGQTKLGSAITAKLVDLDAAPLGVSGSPGGLTFVPASHPGAGQLKIVTWAGGNWYTLGYAPDGTGTFTITSSVLEVTIPGGPEGIAYIPPGSPLFPAPSVLVSEYSAGEIGVYQTDANGDPVLATRQDFITGLTGAEGAFIDPVTGDFLFSTFGGGNHVIVVRGFVIPEPGTWLLAAVAMCACVLRLKFRTLKSAA
jgi:hypothetical protein